jgi:hypothetical protein
MLMSDEEQRIGYLRLRGYWVPSKLRDVVGCPCARCTNTRYLWEGDRCLPCRLAGCTDDACTKEPVL